MEKSSIRINADLNFEPQKNSTLELGKHSFRNVLLKREVQVVFLMKIKQLVKLPGDDTNYIYILDIGK